MRLLFTATAFCSASATACATATTATTRLASRIPCPIISPPAPTCVEAEDGAIVVAGKPHDKHPTSDLCYLTGGRGLTTQTPAPWGYIWPPRCRFLPHRQVPPICPSVRYCRLERWAAVGRGGVGPIAMGQDQQHQRKGRQTEHTLPTACCTVNGVVVVGRLTSEKLEYW